jgi:hypothetical protein
MAREGGISEVPCTRGVAGTGDHTAPHQSITGLVACVLGGQSVFLDDAECAQLTAELNNEGGTDFIAVDQLTSWLHNTTGRCFGETVFPPPLPPLSPSLEPSVDSAFFIIFVGVIFCAAMAAIQQCCSRPGSNTSLVSGSGMRAASEREIEMASPYPCNPMSSSSTHGARGSGDSGRSEGSDGAGIGVIGSQRDYEGSWELNDAAIEAAMEDSPRSARTMANVSPPKPVDVP